MSLTRVLIITLTDDPLDPPGADRYGGAQKFMFDLGRFLVRSGHSVTYLTRRSRPDKPLLQDLGPRCRIYRVDSEPPAEVNHHSLWRQVDELSRKTQEIIAREERFGCVLSYNWISGLIANVTGVRPLIHHILSLGRVRLELGEEPDASDHARDRGELEIFHSADRLICACSDEYKSLRTLYPEVDTEKRAIIVPYGVDADVYCRRPLDANLFLRRTAERLEEGARSTLRRH